MDQVCHVNIKPLTAKIMTYLQRIETPLVILLHGIAGPLKLCKSQSQNACHVNIIPLIACFQSLQGMSVSLSPVKFSKSQVVTLMR